MNAESIKNHRFGEQVNEEFSPIEHPFVFHGVQIGIEIESDEISQTKSKKRNTQIDEYDDPTRCGRFQFNHVQR